MTEHYSLSSFMDPVVGLKFGMEFFREIGVLKPGEPYEIESVYKFCELWNKDGFVNINGYTDEDMWRFFDNQAAYWRQWIEDR